MTFWSSWIESMPSLLPRQGAAGPVAPAQRRRMALDTAETGQTCCIIAVQAPEVVADWARWLNEIGFLPGERVTVTTRSPWGGDPMVVRVGESSFALRRAEAACVQVESL